MSTMTDRTSGAEATSGDPSKSSGVDNRLDGITFRTPTVKDGAAMWRMARDSKGLEVNSPYSYLMVCRHFADTCILAEDAGTPVGFISGHRPQTNPEVVFVWQIAVNPDYRGRGIAGEMLSRLVDLPGCREVRYLEATVTPSNEASQRAFAGLAKRKGTSWETLPGFPADAFPEEAGVHEAEDVFRIGPLK